MSMDGKIVRLAGEDHLYLLKSVVGDCPALEQEFLIPYLLCSDKRDLSSKRRTSVAHSHIFPRSEWHMYGARKQIFDLLLAYVPHDWISAGE